MGTTVHRARVAFIMTSSLVKVTFRQNSYSDWQILRALNLPERVAPCRKG
jgi:hypothetical protein